jgi:poly-gamma-glutamate synthesis protein (capsule biosynthesis protein)
VKSAARQKVEGWQAFFRLLFALLLCEILGTCASQAPTVRLALLGDIMIGRGVNPTSASLSYLEPDISSADLALANLESPLAPTSPPFGSGYNLCAPSARAALLAEWKLGLLSLANNHQLDCGEGGAAMTRSALAAVGITPIGPGMEPVFRKVHGLQLAFLAFDDVSSPLDIRSAAQAVRSARQTGAVVIVALHWGAEYQGGASERQVSLAQTMASAGAALIWGAHPHVLQPSAWIRTAQGRTLVLYSLGNALFDQGGLEDTRRSALVQVTVSAQGVQGVYLVPFLIDPTKSRVVKPDAMNAEKIRARINLP